MATVAAINVSFFYSLQCCPFLFGFFCQGIACGGGFVMAACCDRRIMASGCGGVGFTEIKLVRSFGHCLEWLFDVMLVFLGHNDTELVSRAWIDVVWWS